MKSHNFILSNIDTDAIAFCKQDFGSLLEESDSLLTELNSIFPDEINFTEDGYFPVFIVLKAKNYIIYDGKKIKLKGSSLKSATLEPILKEMLNEFINTLVFVENELERNTKLQEIYMRYIYSVHQITDIKPWCTKKTLSATTYASERKNETDIIDAIVDSEYVEGDKVFLYATLDEKWALAERFDGNYSYDTYYGKLFKTTQRFSTIIDTKSLFKNYSLQKPQKELHEQLGIINPKPVAPKKPRKKKEVAHEQKAQ